MRTLSDGFLELLLNPVPFLLFRVGPNPSNLYYAYTTLSIDYVYNNYTYSAQNRITGIDTPRISDSLDRATFTISLTDSDGYLRSTLDTWKMHNSPFVVYIGLLNNTSNKIGSTKPGEPYPELMTAYEGTVDTFGYAISPDEDIILEIEGTSPMSALDLTRTIITSDNYMRQKFGVNNTSYSQVFEGSDKILIGWGIE